MENTNNATGEESISFPEPANFLRRMLDENEGSEKDRFLGYPDWLSEIRYLRTIFRTGPFHNFVEHEP